MFAINARFKAHRVTGVQRYAAELCARFQSSPRLLEPSRRLTGVAAHLWEQSVLPTKLRNHLLWSPCNMGPLVAKRQIVTVHDIIAIEHPEWFSRKFAVLYATFAPLLLRQALHVIAVSQHTRDSILRRFKIAPEKITTIANGVGDQFYPRNAEEIFAALKRYGIPQGRYVLSVGRIEPRKNLDRIIEAWAQVEKLHDNVNLIIAGPKLEGVFRPGITSRLTSRVIQTGYVSEADLPALYSGASCFVYPSLYEGFGLPILEALACGTPTISSNSTSIPEIAGPNTTLVDPFSVAAIASAISNSLAAGSQDTELAAAGRLHAAKYTWNKTTAETERLLLAFC